MKTDVHEEESRSASASRPRDVGQAASSKPQFNKDEVMKKVQAAGTPGAGHKVLDALVGDWKAEVKCWMEPDAPPSVSQATSRAKWILGGRFLEEDFHGQMMGKPFTGRGIFGYDNAKQKFKSVWMDDVSTGIVTTEGSAQNDNKLITLEGKADCPGTGQKDVPMKQVFRVVSPDKHVLEMFNNGRKAMEITYTRQ